MLAGNGADGGARGAGLLVDSPPGLLAVCRSATASARMPPRCPAAIPVPNGEWGRSRALDDRPCQYLIDVEPGPGSGPPDRKPIFHLLFGGRCRPFDLTADDGRWPVRGFITDGLRLVGLRPLRPGESGRPDGFAPARPRVLARLRVGTSPALLLRQRSYPLTTVHSAIWPSCGTSRTPGTRCPAIRRSRGPPTNGGSPSAPFERWRLRCGRPSDLDQRAGDSTTRRTPCRRLGPGPGGPSAGR
jgi:hypothetical protein